MQKENLFVSVVSYVRNNGACVDSFYKAVSVLQEKYKNCELIFVDDCSDDGSPDIIKKYFEENHSDCTINIIRLGCYHGLESAMNAGRDMSIGDFVYEFDSLYVDFDRDVIIEAYNKCLEGNDIVCAASRTSPIKLTSKLFYKVFNKESGMQTELRHDSFKLMSRRAINRICSMGVDIPYRKAVYLDCGFSSAFIEYEPTAKKPPKQFKDKYERLELAVSVLIYFTDIVKKISVILATIVSVAFVVFVLGLLVAVICGQTFSLSWIAAILLLFVVSTFLLWMGVLTIKYLSVILDVVFAKQKYLISSIDNVPSKKEFYGESK